MGRCHPCRARSGPSSAAPSSLKNQRPPRMAFEHAPRSLVVSGVVRVVGWVMRSFMPGPRGVLYYLAVGNMNISCCAVAPSDNERMKLRDESSFRELSPSG